MQAALLKNRSVLDEHRVSKLYKTALLVYNGGAKATSSANDRTISLVCTTGRDGGLTVTCTDVETGLFIQLSGDPAKGWPLLVFGKKFCQESRDQMRQNVATKIW